MKNLRIQRLLLSPDDGAAGGPSHASGNPDGAQDAPDGQQKPPAQVLGKDGKPFDPERAQRTIETLQGENKEGRAAIAKLAQIEADQKKADEEAARQRGEFESIANTRTAERDEAIRDRDGLTAERDAYAAIVERDVKTRLEKLPEAARKFVPPATQATPLQRLEKISELEAQIEALKPAAPAVNPGARGTMGGITPARGDGTDQAARAAHRASMGY